MPASDIIIKGAREHNLRDVDLVLPRNQLICLSGVSGSGKSSLAFDTLFAEGQRRYVESLSSFARQFLGQMPKPDVDLISGLSPSISISQKSSGNNPRSTVGTMTEIYDFCGSCLRERVRDSVPSVTNRSRHNRGIRSLVASCCCRKEPNTRSWRPSFVPRRVSIETFLSIYSSRDFPVSVLMARSDR